MTSPPTKWLHGSGSRIEAFHTSFVGVGNDEGGPGVYFTDRDETAEHHAGKNGDDRFVMEVEIVGPLASPNFKLSRRMVEQVVSGAPDLEARLEDFGDVKFEGRPTVMARLSNAYAGMPIREAAIALSNDIFRGKEARMLPFLADATGYVGHIRQFPSGERHAVVWSIEAIRVIATRELERAAPAP